MKCIAKHVIYADDTILLYTGGNTNELQELINKDLQTFQ